MGKRFGHFFFGVLFIGFGIHALVNGEVSGLGNLATASRTISFNNSPVEYSIVLLFCFGLGGAFIWASTKKD